MAILSKTQLGIDIAASTFTAPQQTILENMVDSYEDIFAQVTTVQRDALTPVNGQIVYNTDNDRYEYWNGVSWFGIGQDLSTPLVVKVDLSSADILDLMTTPIQVASAPPAGYALIPQDMVYRFTFGSVQYAGTFSVRLYSASNTSPFYDLDSSVIKANSNRSGKATIQTSSSYNAIAEATALNIAAITNNPTTGDGTLTVWVTYSIIVY